MNQSLDDRLDLRESDQGQGLDESIQPLAGEAGIPSVQQHRHHALSKKGLVAAGLFVAATAGVAAAGIVALGSTARKAEGEQKLVKDRPAAASSDPRKLDLPVPKAASAAAAAVVPRVPALIPTEAELAEPIGVRRTGRPAAGGGVKEVRPEDAPVMLVTSRPASVATPPDGMHPSPAANHQRREADPPSNGVADPLEQTRRNLEAYQRQLHGLLDDLTRSTGAAVGAGPSEQAGGALIGLPSGVPLVNVVPSASVVASQATGLFGGALPRSATPRVAAGTLGNRSLTLPKGTAFTCALKTKIISAGSGLVGCQVQRNVYSDDGRVLLIERGSHMDGEYRATSVRPGTVRIPVLWTRIRTPHGVTVDIDSGATGQLGESGIDGYVDNRWGERIGAAMLLSLIDDSVKLVIQHQANEGSGDTIVLPSTTSNTSKLAEKVLDSTISIPPLIYRNQGGIVGIYVARDVDFSSVYELRPTADPARGARP